MRKGVLIKYIKGEASHSEQNSVLEWAAKKQANELYLAKLTNLLVSQNMPQERASAREIENILNLLDKKASTVSTSSLSANDNKNSGSTYSIKKWVAWTVAASIIVLLSTGLYFTSTYSGLASSSFMATTTAKLLNYKNIASTKVLYTEKGVKAKLILPDSSVVWLNSDTRIEYPDKFDSLVRNVTISGEAFFDVVKNPDRPMIVKTTKGFSVQVLGTQFNLKAYENDTKSQATLYSGEINLLRESGNKILTTKILPFQTITINNNDTQYPVRKTVKQSPLDYVAWKEGKIIFEETSIEEVIKTLERWHGIDFIVENKDILSYKITATFNSESIVQIMDLIQMTSLVNYRIENKKVFLRKK